jgi:hypothetical protein
MDAMIFLTVMSIVSIGLCAYALQEEGGETLARSACDDAMGIELRASDVLPIKDTQVFPVADLVAADLNTGGHGLTQSYMKSVLDGLISQPHGYCMTFDYNGHRMQIGRGGGETTSTYDAAYDVNGGGKLYVSLTVM